MKTTLLVLVLVLSLAANAALFFRRGSAGKTTAARAPETTQSAPAPAARAATGAKATDRTEAAEIVQNWAQLQTGDLRTLVARLRAAGFSPSMIRSLVASQVYEQFAARRKALISQQEEIPYWKSQQRFGMDPKTMSELRELSREQTKLIKDLLGPDNVPGNEETQAYQRRQFGNLASDKLDQLQNIASDYNDLRNQVYAAANGVMLPEDREKLALLEKEQRSDMAAVLTPQELEDYELRSSNTANMLRSQLGTFQPTEAEFRAIFEATRAAEDQYGSITAGMANPNQLRQIQNSVLDQAKALLSPERYADLKQATDPAYQMINRLVTRLDLPATAATQVVTVQQDMMQRVGLLRSDQTLTPEQRNIQLSALSQEATTRLTNALGGTRGLEAYKQYGGQWLQSLQPRPAPPPRG